MPIDAMLTDPMLDPFQKMLDDCVAQNITGEDFDNMKAALDRMRELVQTNDDFNVFNGQMVQENLFMKFSDHYSKALSAAAKAGGGEAEDYDDAALLKQSIDALKSAIQLIKDSKQQALDLNASYDPDAAIDQSVDYAKRHQKELGVKINKRRARGIKKDTKKMGAEDLKEKPNMNDNSVEIDTLINNDAIIEGIQNLIALGEQDGMTLPRFLREQIEKGLDRAAEGVGLVRDGYEYTFNWSNATKFNPYEIKRNEDKIAVYDKLAESSDFNIPHVDELNHEHALIDYKHAPDDEKWQEIIGRWEDLLSDLDFWSLAYTPIAPHIEPWKLAKDPVASTKKTQGITPGLFRQRERLLEKYFGITFMEIFKHPTFAWHVEHNLIDYSQEFTEFLIEKVYPACIPHQDLASDLIAEREAFYKENRGPNPEGHFPAVRNQKFYDSKFGEGRFESKFGKVPAIDSNAAPWNWESFKHK